MNQINGKKHISEMNQPVELSELEIELELAFWTIGNVNPLLVECGAQPQIVKRRSKNIRKVSRLKLITEC